MGSDTRPKNKTLLYGFSHSSSLALLVSFFFFFVVVRLSFSLRFFYPRAEMNQRLLAWHGMKAGMDDERKEGWR